MEIDKERKYSDSYDLSPFEAMEFNKLSVIEIEVFKSTNDRIPARIKAKTPNNIPFSVCFLKFIRDYNMKSPKQPIEMSDGAELYSWIFYVKRSFFHRRKYIDYDLSIKENKIKELEMRIMEKEKKLGDEAKER